MPTQHTSSILRANAARRICGILPRFRGRDRLVNLFLRDVKGDCLCKLFGLSYRGTLDNLIDREVYVHGSYSAHELAFLEAAVAASRTLGEPVTFYDIGANVGNHTMFMSRICDSVVAFEPNEAPWQRLQWHVKENALRNVNTIKCALYDKDCDLTFELPRQDNLGTGMVVHDSSLQQSNQIQVPGRTGDSLVQESFLPRPTILKLDIQGSEYRALKGLAQTIARSHPIALIEISRETLADTPNGLADIDSCFQNSECLELRVSKRKAFSLRPVKPREELDLVIIPRGVLPYFQKWLEH